MPPQPYLPKHAGKRSWGVGVDSARQAPDLLGLIGECVTIWPFVEHDLALGLGGLIDAASDATLAVFASMKSAHQQRDAIIAAAEAVLGKDDVLLVSAALRILGRAGSIRNDLAHGLWGYSHELKDSLLWLDPKYYGIWNVAAVIGESDRVTHDDLEAKFYVYRRKDLEEARDKLLKARTLSFDLAMFLMWKPGRLSTREALRDKVVKHAGVEVELRKLQKQKSPE